MIKKNWKKQQILTVGSATLDLFFQSNDFPEIEKGMRLSLAYGGKYIADEFAICPGGGATNTAVSLARQGFKVFCWSKIANDCVGKQLIDNLKKEKVSIDLLENHSKQTTISIILLGKGRERTIVTFRAANDKLDLNNRVKKRFKKASWVFFSGLARTTKELKLSLIKYAKQTNTKVVLALSGNEYKKGFNYLDEYFQLSDIFMVNAHELADIWGGNAPDLDLNKTNYAKKLKVPLLVVTYDVHGSWAYTEAKIYHQPIVKPTRIIDTTGAGDAFGAGFLGKYIKTNNIQESLGFAAENSASVISHISTQKGLLYDK